MVLFTIFFVVVIVDVGVLKAPSKCRKLPHTVNILLCVSDLFDQILHTISPYVFVFAKDNSLLGMNVKAFVTFILVPNP